MRDKRDNHSPKWWERVFAPLMTLKIEKFYWFWVLSFVISFAGIVVDLLNGDFEASANNGIVYSTCIAIIAPLFIEFLANYISVNHQKKKEEYSTYKAWSMAICIATLIFLFLFYVTKARTSLVLQISCILIVFAVSFYTYLVTKMDIHRTLLEEYKDKSYLELENEILKDTEEKSRKLTSTTTDSGTEVKL